MRTVWRYLRLRPCVVAAVEGQCVFHVSVLEVNHHEIRLESGFESGYMRCCTKGHVDLIPLPARR